MWRKPVVGCMPAAGFSFCGLGLWVVVGDCLVCLARQVCSARRVCRGMHDSNERVAERQNVVVCVVSCMSWHA